MTILMPNEAATATTAPIIMAKRGPSHLIDTTIVTVIRIASRAVSRDRVAVDLTIAKDDLDRTLDPALDLIL
jgi:hypothetical protein